VLDYGGQLLAADRAPSARMRRVLGTAALPRRRRFEVARRRPKGVILSGGPASVYADGGAAAGNRPCWSSAFRSWASVTGCSCWPSRSGTREGAEVGEFGRSQLDRLRTRTAAGRHPRRADLLDVASHTVFAPPPGFTALAASTASPVAAFESPERAVYGIQSTPRSSTLRTAAGSDQLPVRCVRLRSRVERRVGDRGPDRADPGAGRRRTGDLRTVRRRGLERGGAAGAPGDRRSPDVCCSSITG